MSVYIIDYASVGSKGLKEIQNTAGNDAVFFIYSASEGSNPVEVQKKDEKKEAVNPVKVSMDVLNRARAAFAQNVPAKAEQKKSQTAAKQKPKAEPKAKSEPKAKAEPKPKAKQEPTVLTDDIKRKLRAAVKPVGLKTAQYAMLYKAFSESPDKNEYNIALQRSFKVQKKANDIYKQTRPLFEEIKGN